jgi:hypothetical protein
MLSEASYGYGYEENFSDKCRNPVGEENFHYTPKEKRKLERPVERCSKVCKCARITIETELNTLSIC